MINAFRSLFFVLMALILVAKIALPLAHAQDEDTSPQGQQTISEDMPAPAPTPYSSDDDPGIQAEPIDDDGDF